jgi:hypothetical protein
MSNKLVKEDENSREFASQFYRVWAPADTDVQSTDRFRWRGKQLEGWGTIGVYPDLNGQIHHVQFLTFEREG